MATLFPIRSVTSDTATTAVWPYNQPSSRHGKQLSFFSTYHLQWRKDRWLPNSSFSQEPKGIMATWREKNEIKTTKEKNGGKNHDDCNILQSNHQRINSTYKTIHIFSVLPEKNSCRSAKICKCARKHRQMAHGFLRWQLKESIASAH